MTPFERLDLHKIDLDSLTLRRVLELELRHHIELVLVCTTPDCRRRAKVDLIDRVDRYGAESTLRQLRRRSRCTECDNRNPKPYLVIEGARRFEAQWYPRRPP